MFACDILGKDSVVPRVSLISDERYLTNRLLILRRNNVADKYLSDQINTSAKKQKHCKQKDNEKRVSIKNSGGFFFLT